MCKSKRFLALFLALAFTLSVACTLLAPDARAVTYSQGSSGSAVTQIQTRLKNWGYYTGSVDGVYGAKTTAAVKYFQRTNGLTADGVAGPDTLEALGLPTGSAGTYNSSTVSLLARLIAAEARGEPYSGQVAVGAVVMNRVASPAFPNTVAGVIYQSGAFTCVSDGQFSSVTVTDTAYAAARAAINGADPTGGAIYYFNPATATSSWIWSRPLLVVIGNHRFCA